MTYSEPKGYRLPSEVKITAIARALERFGWPIWQVETVRAVASVALELLGSADERESVYQRLSHGQITEADLVISEAQGHGLVMRAAEFLSVGHALMRRASGVPLPPHLDLRARAQFMDDQGDPYRKWTYVLFGTERKPLEDMFVRLHGMEAFPRDTPDELGDSDDPPAGGVDDLEREMRSAVWDRVLAPYARFSPLSISAPEPQVAFDIAESLRQSDRDTEFHVQGKTTVTAVVAEVTRQLGDTAPADLRERLIAPIKRDSTPSAVYSLGHRGFEQ